MINKGNTVSSQNIELASYSTDSGIADAYAVTLRPVPQAYSAGMKVVFKATNNNTGPSTLNVNGLGAVSIRKSATSPLAAGDILAGQIIEVTHDGTNFQIKGNVGGGGQGVSGYSGYSGASISGFSGYSGNSSSGFSGYSGTGFSGFSGYSGLNGTASSSGYSGFSGYSGYSGVEGESGISGYSGKSGYSGFSGAGFSGFSGYSGLDGTAASSGYSGFSGRSGYSGYSGYSGLNGESGYSGYSGKSGYSGFSGRSGYSGFSGAGFSGYSGYSGQDGLAASSGYSGYSGAAGGGGGIIYIPSDKAYVGITSGTGSNGTSGGDNDTFGIFVGQAAGAANTSGSNNIYLGVSAGTANVTGSFNTGIGNLAGGGRTIGSFNQAIGYKAGFDVSGDNNINIGIETNSTNGVLNFNGVKNITIGYRSQIFNTSGSNQLVIGNIIYGTTLDGTGSTISTGRIGIKIGDPAFDLHVNGIIGTEQKIALREIASSATPPVNYGYIYEKTDGKFYGKNSTGTEYDLTSGGGGATITVQESDGTPTISPVTTLQFHSDDFVVTNPTTNTSLTRLKGVIAQNSLFVSKAGSNTTGTRNRIDLPYLTVTAALAVALSGDTIYVFPGTYEEPASLIFKDGVNFHFLGRGTLQVVTTDTTSIFKDNAVAVTTEVVAHGWTFEARVNQGVFILSAASTLTFYLDKMTSVGKQCLSTAVAGTTVRCTFNSAYSTGANSCIKQVHGAMYLTCESMENNTPTGSDPNTLHTLGNVTTYVRAKRIETTGASAGDLGYLGGSLSDTARIYIDADLIKCTHYWAFFPTGGASRDIHVKAKRIECTSDCVLVSGVGMLTAQVDEVVMNSTDANIDGIVHAEAGNLTLIGSRLIRTQPATGTGRDLLTSAGGTIQIIGVSYMKDRVFEETAGEITRIDSTFRSGIDVGAYTALKTKTSGVSSLTLNTTATTWIFTGSTTTWTLPAVSGTADRVYIIKNRGTGSITLNANGGLNQIYDTAATNTITVTAGSTLRLQSDGTYWLVI